MGSNPAGSRKLLGSSSRVERYIVTVKIWVRIPSLTRRWTDSSRVERLFDKQKVVGSIPTRCSWPVWRNLVDAVDSKFITLWFVGSSPTTGRSFLGFFSHSSS